jgi:hypothetical protein
MSHGLFLTFPGEKYEKHKKHIYSTYNKQQHMCGGVSEKSLI